MTESKIDKLQDDITEIKVTMAKISVTLEDNTDSLKDHMLRTSMAEDRIKDLEKFSYILKTAWLVLSFLGGIILGLNQLGLFKL